MSCHIRSTPGPASGGEGGAWRPEGEGLGDSEARLGGAGTRAGGGGGPGDDDDSDYDLDENLSLWGMLWDGHEEEMNEDNCEDFGLNDYLYKKYGGMMGLSKGYEGCDLRVPVKLGPCWGGPRGPQSGAS